MIRFLRAFAWLRWRLLLNSVRGSKRRDTLEQVSRLLALVVPAMIVVMSLGSIVTVSVAGALGGYALTTGTVGPALIVIVVRGLLLVVTALVIFLPMGGAAQTTSTKYSRLLLLPIPARGLHLVEVLAGLADPWLLFVLPGLVLLAIGLAAGGWLVPAMLVLAAAAGVAAVLASLGALISFSVSWLFRDRRRAEWLTVVFIVAISAVALVPQFIGQDQMARQRADKAAGRPRNDMTLERFNTTLPTWTRVFPSEMFGQVVTHAAITRQPATAALWVGALALQASFFFWLSALVHARLLASAGGSSSRRVRQGDLAMPWRLPLITREASAVAWVMVKTSVRSVRGRIAILVPGPMVALVSIALMRSPEEAPWIALLGSHGHFLFGASLLFVLLAIQPFTMNQFASDRTGLTQQWILPISETDLVRGKAVGGGILFLIAMVVAAIAVGIVSGGAAPMNLLTVAIGGVATYVSVTPVTALLSAWFPVAADLSKAGSGGNPHPVTAIVGMFVVIAAALPVALIAVPNLLPVPSPFGSMVVMFVWLAVVTSIAWPLLALVARVVTARRENLFLTVTKS